MFNKLSRHLFTFGMLFLPMVLWGQDTRDVITPAVGPLPGHTCDVIIDAEFLWWYSSITDLSYALKGKTIATGDQVQLNEVSSWVPNRKEEFDWTWDPGVRLGLGAVTNHDGWDAYAEWTYFYNRLGAQSSVAPFTSSDLGEGNPNPPGIGALTSAWFLNPNGEFLQKVRAKWALLFNQIDLQLGRKYWISHFLSLHPFAGVRGYWARMDYDVKGSRPVAADATFYETRSVYKQKSWAVGLLTGLNVAWHMTHEWSIFSDAAVALTYGKYWVRRKASEFEVNQTNQVVGDLTAKTLSVLYQMQPFVDLALGVRWERIFNQSFRLLLDLGWESHFLIDFNQLFRGTEPSISFTDLPSTNGNLTLSGIVARGRVEF